MEFGGHNDEALEAFVLRRVAMLARAGTGARFPSPLRLIDAGRPTDLAAAAARMAGLAMTDGWVYELEREVMRAIKQLHHDGRVTYLWRFGYTWIVPAGWPAKDGEEAPGPQRVNEPHYWSSIPVRGA